MGGLYVALKLSKALSVKYIFQEPKTTRSEYGEQNLPVPVKVDVVSVAVSSTGTDHLREPV